MDLENNQNIENTNNLINEKEQNSFLESTLGKVINSAIDVGLRMLLPDFAEDGVIEVKNALFTGGLKEGIDTAINGAINMGKSILGIFTGKFENVSQARDAIKTGGLIDGLSGVLDSVINKTNSSGLINDSVASIISNGKDAILNSVSNKIENEFMQQIDGTEKLAKYESNWKEYFNNRDFEGMEREYGKIKDKLKELMPIENTLKEARVIENLHMLIKNNGQDFNLTKEQLELANLLT